MLWSKYGPGHGTKPLTYRGFIFVRIAQIGLSVFDYSTNEMIHFYYSTGQARLQNILKSHFLIVEIFQRATTLSRFDLKEPTLDRTSLFKKPTVRQCFSFTEIWHFNTVPHCTARTTCIHFNADIMVCQTKLLLTEL